MTGAGSALLAGLLSLSACAGPACPDGTRAATAARLYFGRSLAGGTAVDPAAWAGFLAAEVTPRFPDGLTVLDGRGQWRAPGAGQVVSEPSTVVEIVAEDSAATRARLEAIRAAYRRQFGQDSVGLTLAPVCASF
jgi:hypothetical protein